MLNEFISINNFNNNLRIICNKNIKGSTIILEDIPICNDKTYLINSDINILYNMFDYIIDEKIDQLYPRTYDNINNINKKGKYSFESQHIIKQILKCQNKKIKRILLYDESKLELYYYKYLFNAFTMYNKPIILAIGSKFNHSCNPNIIFYERDNKMVFETKRDIKKGEELFISYLRNVPESEILKHSQYLLDHYNFNYLCNHNINT